MQVVQLIGRPKSLGATDQQIIDAAAAAHDKNNQDWEKAARVSFVFAAAIAFAILLPKIIK